MSPQPVFQSLAPSGFGVGAVAGAQHGHEDGGFALRSALRVKDGDGVAGVIDEELFARLVLVAQHHIQMAVPAMIEFREAAVALAVGVVLAVFLPLQEQRQAAVGLKFLVKVREVRRGPLGFRRALDGFTLNGVTPNGLAPSGSSVTGMRVERFFQPRLVPAFLKRPSDARRPGPGEAIRNTGLRDRTTASDLILAQAQFEPEPQHFLDFPHGQFFRRQCRFLLLPEEPRLPDSCPASLPLTFVGVNPTSPNRPRSRAGDPSPHPGTIITIPGIAITMTPESLLRSSRNGHHDHVGIAITMARNPQVANQTGGSGMFA